MNGKKEFFRNCRVFLGLLSGPAIIGIASIVVTGCTDRQIARHTKEYEFAKNAGDRVEACKHVGPLIYLNRTTRNAEEYKKWVTVRDGDCLNYRVNEVIE